MSACVQQIRIMDYFVYVYLHATAVQKFKGLKGVHYKKYSFKIRLRAVEGLTNNVSRADVDEKRRTMF